MKKVVLLIYLLISIYSCNTKNKKTDLEKLNLKGDVICIITEGGFGSPILEFDNNGYLLRTIDYHSNDVDGIYSLDETTFIRDSTYKLIIEKEQNILNYARQSLLPITKKYNYLNDKLSTITYQNEYGEDVLEEYKYENDNLIEIKEVFYSKDQDVRSSISTTKFYYNKKNHLDSTRRILVYEDGSIDNKITKIYLPNGLLKSYQVFSNTFNDAKSILYFNLRLEEYKYNDKNDLIEVKETDLKKNEVTRLINFNYIYDDKNNWVEKTKIDTHSKFKEQYIEKRKIIYKGENYTEDIAKYDLLILKYKSNNQELNPNTKEFEESSSVSVFPSQNNEKKIYNNTPKQKEKRKCYSCNGTGQCSKCSKPQRVRYKQGESPHDHNEIRQGMIVCHQCGGNLMDFGSDKNKSCYLCKASGWLNCRECNSNGNGNYIGKCQRCKGTGFDR